MNISFLIARIKILLSFYFCLYLKFLCMKNLFRFCAALIALLPIILPARAQYIAPAQKSFTRQDTLRGSITPERAWWDLTYYHLDIAVKPSDSAIYGSNTVTYRVINSSDVMQIDLQPPLEILNAEQNGKSSIFHGKECILDPHDGKAGTGTDLFCGY
jgi:hypothetical protein